MHSPVLFLIFNRPDTTRRVFDAIRAARPPKLYIAADGPRPTRPDEVHRCNAARSIASAVDWPCEVHTLFREKNLGCKLGVSSAVTWFFSQESEGVVLEDDVLPGPSFFEYCDQLLARYRDDESVAMITGCNLISRQFTSPESYFFSRYNHIWGWASWRRAWQHYDCAMGGWPIWRDSGGLERISGNDPLFAAHWRPIFDAVHAGNIDTWDYQWTYACWRRDGLTAMPAFNQTLNLGFGADATHTTAPAPAFVAGARVEPLEFPLLHPHSIRRNLAADALIDSKVFGISRLSKLKQRLLNVPLVGSATATLRALIKNAIS